MLTMLLTWLLKCITDVVIDARLRLSVRWQIFLLNLYTALSCFAFMTSAAFCCDIAFWL